MRERASDRCPNNYSQPAVAKATLSLRGERRAMRMVPVKKRSQRKGHLLIQKAALCAPARGSAQ